ncbi:T3SS regulon anti-activator ExsD family protein [Shewanella sp. VB17]|uniref:T3SS regulon anti-activator ExsD domain-containing protein n=1 Tax=Shewanella sp. VB17 TaxID=2739432 RepID=UPI0015662CF3|nr:T3SS regulon anti-activator ExsD domain-containing protein [Shewanella sp. VB17]NRD71739.1 T3SS regulon anti-activator ExsD family protein [Shewanella sp. VB17]
MASESMNKSKFTGRKISLVANDSCVRVNLSSPLSAVNVNHKELVAVGVVNQQQLLLLKRVIERRVLDCILASDYIKTCIDFNVSLTKNDLKLFLQISADIFRGSQQRQMHELLAEVNAGLMPKFNLGHVDMLAKLVCKSVSSWLLKKRDSDDVDISHEYQALSVLKSQLESKVNFWCQLKVNDINEAYLEAHVKEARKGLEECQVQLLALSPLFAEQQVYKKQVVDSSLLNLKQLILNGPAQESFSSCLNEISLVLPELTGVLNMINDLSLGYDIDHSKLWDWLRNANSLSPEFLFEVDRQKQVLLRPVWQQVK